MPDSQPEPRTIPPQPHSYHHYSHNNPVLGRSAAVGSTYPAVVESLAVDNLVVGARLVAGSKAAAAGIVRYLDPRLGGWEEGRRVLERHCAVALALPSVLGYVCGAGKREEDPSWQHPCLRWR